jgi:hypothetical protein
VRTEEGTSAKARAQAAVANYKNDLYSTSAKRANIPLLSFSFPSLPVSQNMSAHTHGSSSSTQNIVGVHYRVGKKIGEGSFGVIFEGQLPPLTSIPRTYLTRLLSPQALTSSTLRAWPSSLCVPFLRFVLAIHFSL